MSLVEQKIRAELARILESETMRRSHRLRGFLHYVVDLSLNNQDVTIKEYTIGVEVYKRPESFDPRLDAIVRVEARRLRTKLHQYYQGEGKNDPIRIMLSPIGYLPRFQEVSVQVASATATHSTSALVPYPIGR